MFATRISSIALALAVAVASLAGAPGRAAALQIVQTFDYVLSDTVNIDADAGTAYDSFSDREAFHVNRFDPELGRLDSVEQRLSGYLVTSAQARFADPRAFSTATGDLFFWLSISVDGSIGNYTNLDRTDSCSAAGDWGGASCVVTLAPQTTSFGPLSRQSALPAALSIFQGPGTLILPLRLTGGFLLFDEDVEGPGFIDWRWASARAEGQFSVIYNYTAAQPAPIAASEPASTMILAIGCIGVALIRRRRNVRATRLRP